MRARLFLAAAVLVSTSWTAVARADGAFPDSQSILTPAQLPNETLLATNFGLVMSFDRDQTWTYSCEQDLSQFAILYSMGAAPLNRIYAVSQSGAIYTDDTSCTWHASTGMGAAAASDVFADPTNVNRVLAVTSMTNGDAGALYMVVESSDAGTSFSQVRYTAAAGDRITGVEIARSNPQTIYLTLTSGAAYTPKVAVSTNGGGSWTLHDLSASLPSGTFSIYLVSVDPSDPQKLILRVGSSAGQALAISSDGGTSATVPLSFPGGVFTAFARMDSGSLIAGGAVGTSNVAYRSTDNGATWPALPPVPFTFKGMSARGKKLYAALSNMTDFYAIETSSDEGMTWDPLLHFNSDDDGGATGSIQAIQACVHTTCQPDCTMRAAAYLFSDYVCSATPMPEPIDGGGTGGTSGGGTGGSSGGGTGGAGGGHPITDGGHQDAAGTPTSSSGCKCTLGSDPSGGPPFGVALAAAALMLGRRARRR
jgi:MYXO-CTERM domain-containing protein